MNNEMRRVGLVFTQEGAVDFRKSLQEINIEMNKNYNQFKLTQSQWDQSTKSTQKLREEQEYLKNAYELQADKVSTLRMQLADLENSENRNTAAIKKKQNELTTAEIKMKDYEKRIKNIDQELTNHGKKLEEAGEKIHKFGEKVERAGKKLSVFSAATTAALIASGKAAIDFESAFAGVEKTVDGTKEQMNELKQGIRDMAKEIPSSTTEIAAVAEAAGQLGIKTEDILAFTRVMIDLGNSTNLSAEEAASSLAKFANVTKMSAKDYDRLGATIVALGNNFATTEADIVSMATNLAASGELAGLSQSQILALATAMSSVGIEAQAGGSAMSKLLKKIQVASETGSKDLDKFARVAGMTSKEFKQAFEKDAVKALTAFIAGLNDTERNGKSAISILDDMGLTEVRLSNTILSLANASDLMTKAVDMGSQAWKENTALTNEANKRYDTLKSKITVALNQLKDIAITIGNKLMPSIEKLLDKGTRVTKWIENLNEGQVDAILKIGLVVAALGPLLKILGTTTSVVGTAVKGIGTFTQAIGVMNGSVTTSSAAASGLASVLTNMANPTVIATTAVVALTGALIYFSTQESEAQKAARELSEEVEKQSETLDDYNKSVEESMHAELGRIDSVSRLKDELSLLVDENGKVDEKNRGRVQFILNELNQALGTEYSLNGNIIDSYKKLQDEIDGVIDKEKARIILNSKKDKYTNAINQNESYTNESIKAANAIYEKGFTTDELSTLLKQYDKLMQEFDNYNRNKNATMDDIKRLNQELDVITGKLGTNRHGTKEIQILKDLNKAYEGSLHNVKVITEAKKDYESAYADFMDGNYKDINNSVTINTEDWCDKSLEKINDSIKEQKKYLEQYKDIYEKTGDEISKANVEQASKNMKALTQELVSRTSTIEMLGPMEVEAWKTLANSDFEAYKEGLSKMAPEMRQKITEATGVLYEQKPNVIAAMISLSHEMMNQVKNDKGYQNIAIGNLKGFLNGLSDSTLMQLLKQAGIKDSEKVLQGIRSGNLAEAEGIAIIEALRRGLNNTSSQSKLFDAAGFLKKKLFNALGNINISFGAIPGHKLGLDYVPRDDYVARLHKGERVLTKEENEAYTRAEEQASNNNESILGGDINYNKMAEAFTKALSNAKFEVDEDGFGRLVQKKLYEVI